MTDLRDIETPPADWDPEADAPGAVPGGGVRGAHRQGEYARLREECPVAYSDHHGGFYTLTRYADVREAARDHKRFRSGQPFISAPGFNQSIPIGLNPPEHATYRRMLNKYFVPARMEELEPRLRAYADEHLDGLLARGHGEWVSELASPLPARGLCALLGIPDEAWKEMVGHVETLDSLRDDPAKINEIIFGLFAEQVEQLVSERRARPRDPERDLISGVLAMEIDGRPLAHETVLAIGVQIIAAGHSTTTDGLSGAAYRLATNPDIQARLRREPALIPTAIEEFLRLEIPLPEMGRTAGEDIDLHGRTIPAGCPVALNFGSANRDAVEFPNPEACIVDREPNRHLSFGHGVHKCVGAPLGRLEIRVALEQLLSRTIDFELDGRPEPRPAAFIGGFSTLPMRFNPTT